jgi:hypothetical protein
MGLRQTSFFIPRYDVSQTSIAASGTRRFDVHADELAHVNDDVARYGPTSDSITTSLD